MHMKDSFLSYQAIHEFLIHNKADSATYKKITTVVEQDEEGYIEDLDLPDYVAV